MTITDKNEILKIRAAIEVLQKHFGSDVRISVSLPHYDPATFIVQRTVIVNDQFACVYEVDVKETNS